MQLNTVASPNLLYADNVSYPGGKSPGLDPRHVVFSGFQTTTRTRFISVIATANGYINIPKPSMVITPTGTVSFVTNGLTGLALRFANSGNNYASVATGFPALTPAQLTMGMIVTINGTSAQDSVLIGNRTGLSGWGWELNPVTSGTFKMYEGTNGNAAVSGFPAFTVGHSYFLASSMSAAAQTWLAKDLATGVTRTASTASAIPTFADTGTWVVGGTNTIGAASNMDVSAAFLGEQCFLGVSELLQWSIDPWGFWYPGPDIDIFSTLVGKSAVSLNPFQSNLFFM